MKIMLRLLFHHFVPASLYRRPTPFSVLSKIAQEVRQCDRVDTAAQALENSKPGLYALLRARFAQPAAQALTLKILNLYYARYHLESRRVSVMSKPLGLVIDPSNMCELACPGCVHSDRSEELKIFDWSKGTLSQDRLSALLRLYGPYAIGVYFCNYGEPLLNLNTPKLIRLAKSHLLGTALSTSLSVWRFDADSYVESGLDTMVLSIDGATQPVYERFRRHGNLELVLRNVRKLVDAKRRLGKRTPSLSWNYLAFEHNAHEIPMAARMARRLGVNYFRVVNPFDVQWDDPEIRPAAVKSGVRRLDWLSTSNRPENWNPFPDRVDGETIARAFENPWDISKTNDGPLTRGHTCHWLYKNMVMDATGRVMPCCGAPRPDTNLVFGRFDGNNDPFNSKEYRQARSFFSTPLPPSRDDPYCTQCEWDHTIVNIGAPEIRRYFRAADPAFFDRRSLDLLSGW